MMGVVVVGQIPRILGPDNFRWLAYTARAMARLGHQVSVVSFRESVVASPSVRRSFHAFPSAARWLARYEARRVRRREQRLVRLVRRVRPDLVLVLNSESETVSGQALADIKRLSRGPLVAWWTDDPWLYAPLVASASLFDHLFVFDRSYLPRLAALGVRTHFLPCACDETVYRPVALRPRERRRFACGVAFVGWYYPERGPVVKALAAEVDLKIWGGQWDTPAARAALSGTRISWSPGVNDRTAVKIYSASQIGLNVHHMQSRLGGLNMRTFEVLASGLFQLVDRIPGLEELLTPEREVVCYGSAEEACLLAKRYLADPAERAAIAARGRERALAEHTYVCRMRTLLSTVSA